MEESGEFQMLMGEFHHNIDEKNRLVILSKFRNELGDTFIVTRGLDGCLFVYSKDEWAKITEKLKTLPFTQANARKFTRFLLSGAIEAELDKSGRVGITSHLIEYAGITKECVIIGANDRIEIWSKDSWDKFMSDNDEEFASIAENLFTAGDYNAL